MKYTFDLSIVIPTINCPNKLNKLLRLINKQNLVIKKKIELIIIYQTHSKFEKKFNFEHISKINVLMRGKKSLSNAKNLGIRNAKGGIIAFLDDDVLISKDYLKNIFYFFKKHKKIDIVFGAIKIIKKKSYYSRYMTSFKSEINLFNNKKCLASAMVCRRNKKQIYFDQRFGLGSKYPSSEETDFILSCLFSKKYEVFYYPKILLYHPNDEFLKKDIKKIGNKFYSYGIGTGAVYAKYLRKKYLVFFLYLYEVLKSLIGSILGILKLNKYFFYKHSNLLKGKILGFIRFLLSE